jgi:hypothetical protein
MATSGGTVELAGRMVRRLGVSLTELRVTGMWGEPTNRAAALATIRRAADLGADIMEVPVPFGPAADLVREVGEYSTFVVARLTGEMADLDVLRSRLGRRPDLILAEDRLLDDMRDWDIPLGALVGPRAYSVLFHPVAAVRGPSPALKRLVDWCESEGIPYMAPALSILDAGERTIALLPVSSEREVERVFRELEATPRGEGPG